jgi:hypothetical protein
MIWQPTGCEHHLTASLALGLHSALACSFMLRYVPALVLLVFPRVGSIRIGYY